jgi:hypothetical protein
MLNWLVERRASRHISLRSTSRSGMMAPSRAATFDMIRQSGSERAAPWTRARHFYIVQASSTAICARSNRSAAQKNHRARSRPGRWSVADCTEGFETSRRERKKIEMRFAHLKRILKLGRLRLRGPRGAQDEFVGRHRSEPAPVRIAGCATATRSGSLYCVA